MEKEKKLNNPNIIQNPFADFQQIDENSDIFKQMFRYSVIPTIVHDMKMNIINANDSALEEFGYSKKELLTKSIFDLHTKDELDHSAEVLNEMQKKEKMSVETSFVRKDGSVFNAEATPCKYLLGDKPVIHVFIQDITERKQAEKELKNFNQQLQTKNKELEQFAYIASHDLQEPLSTVNNFIKLLHEEYQGKLDENLTQYLHYISEASTRMSELVKGLLDYSRIGKNRELCNIDCNKLVEAVQTDLAAAITASKATFEIGQLPKIKGYKTELRLLFQNLISNSIKFRKNNIPPHIIIKAKKTTDWVFSIQDNGIGIDSKHKERIFIIFQRLHVKNRYEGTGIGLAHCYKIVNLHGGKIWVDSQPDRGSTFYFTIPTL